jgi:hypothetical protein
MISNDIFEKLISLIYKYADKACQCDIMNGFACSIHSEVRHDLSLIENERQKNT